MWLYWNYKIPEMLLLVNQMMICIYSYWLLMSRSTYSQDAEDTHKYRVTVVSSPSVEQRSFLMCGFCLAIHERLRGPDLVIGYLTHWTSVLGCKLKLAFLWFANSIINQNIVSITQVVSQSSYAEIAAPPLELRASKPTDMLAWILDYFLACSIEKNGCPSLVDS